jgi:HK97 family phage prohead protease
MGKLTRKIYASSETKAAEDGARRLTVKISTSSPDRSNDVVLPSGAQLDNYLKNPVVAAFHRYDQPPIGKTVQIQKTDDGIVAVVEFTPEGVNPTADMLFQLYKDGFMNAWSIGFIPTKFAQRGQSWSDGNEIQEWELLEYSAVLVPANPEALTLLRSKGFDPDELIKESEVPPKEDAKPEDKKPEEGNPEPEKKPEAEPEQKPEDKEPEAKEVEVKEGRVLSEKSRSMIGDAVAQLKNAIQAMQELLDATEAAPQSEEEQKPSIDDNSLKFLQGLQKELRKNDKDIGLTLRSLKELLQSNKEVEGVSNE